MSDNNCIVEELMRIKLFILCFIFLSNIVFPADFEFAAGGSVNLGSVMNFTSAVGVSENRKEGFLMGSGINASAIAELGHHYRVSTGATIRTISVSVDLGYNFYSGERDTLFYTYHNLLLGLVAKMHFNNYMALGIGGGVYVPLALYLNYPDPDLIVVGQSGLLSFNMEQIKFMYKNQFMPYIKIVWDNYIYLNEKWALKVDATLLYNFGMALDTEKLSLWEPVGYEQYNFSAFSVEVGVSISFGRPVR